MSLAFSPDPVPGIAPPKGPSPLGQPSRSESVLSGDEPFAPRFSTKPSLNPVPRLHTSAFLAFRLRTDAVDTWRSQVSQVISAFPDLMPPNIGSLVIPIKGIRLLRWSV